MGPIAASAETVERASGTSISIGREAFRYRLGPGDSLAMSVFKMNGYEAKVEVLSDGTINLPRIGTIEVWGLTLEEARQRITAAYEVFLRRPIVYLDLVNSRPVKVTVTGEVKRPGVFSLPTQSETGWPTLVDVVQKAGGVAATGDLSRIEVLRPAARRGGSMRRYQFDYLTVLREGGHAPNPLIYDGDSIRLYKNEEVDNADLITTAASNFAPDTIRVNVIGEVAKPGIQQVPSNAPLSQAIFASGGITRRGSISTVELVRVGGDGEPGLVAGAHAVGVEAVAEAVFAAEEGAGGLERSLPRHQRWLAGRVATQARRWTSAEIDSALAGLLDVDRLLKASPHTDEHFLEAWILGLRVRAEAA